MIQLNKNISIVGTGNVATQLVKAFQGTEFTVTHVASRTVESATEFASSIGAKACKLEELPNDQFTIVCVSDDAISKVLLRIDLDTPVAYTSGSVSIDKLPNRMHLGVFYPLQTFTKEREVNMREVPFFIEATTKRYGDLLTKLASAFSDHVSYATSKERSKLHLTAVFVNNFTNHILHQAKTYADANDVDFKHLLPLLSETIKKLDTQDPKDVQTGPARRGDELTLLKHINELEGDAKAIYELLSKSIKKTYSDNDEL